MDKHEFASENLKAHISSMFGMPANIKDAFHAWVDSVEHRLASMTNGTLTVESTVGDGARRADDIVQPAQPAKLAEQSKPEGKPAEQAKPADKPADKK